MRRIVSDMRKVKIFTKENIEYFVKRYFLEKNITIKIIFAIGQLFVFTYAILFYVAKKPHNPDSSYTYEGYFNHNQIVLNGLIKVFPC